MSNADANSPVARWQNLPYQTREKVYNWLLNLLLACALVLLMFPVYWMLVSSVIPSTNLFTLPHPLLPPHPTLATYGTVFHSKIMNWYKNSIIVAAGVVLISTVASTLAGYGLARIDIPFKKTFARVILFGYMFPPILLSIPMYILWRQAGMLNSMLGIILALTATTLPFSIWLMWQFFQTVPYSLEESALMGGSTRFQAFYDIALPLAKPGMIAVAIFAFAIAWSSFTVPSILLSDSSKYVLTLGLYSFTQSETVNWGQIMAASTLMVLPTFLFVYYLQKYILQGFRTGNF